MPKFSISGLMAVVLIVALNFGIGRAVSIPPMFTMPLSELLIIGGFPMGNILAIGLAVLIAGRHNPGPRRPALIGFEAFGLAAWLAFLSFAFLAAHATHGSVRGLVRASHLQPGLGLASYVTGLFLAPQLAVAMLGWWAGRSGWLRRWRVSSKPPGYDLDFELPGVKANGT